MNMSIANVICLGYARCLPDMRAVVVLQPLLFYYYQDTECLINGTKVHKSVLILLYIDQIVADVVCFASDIPQSLVINHLVWPRRKNRKQEIFWQSLPG